MAEENQDFGEQSYRKLYTINVAPQNSDTLFTAVRSVAWPDSPIEDFQPIGAFLSREGILAAIPSSSSSSSLSSSSYSSSYSSSSTTGGSSSSSP